ncbi:MAG TPA: nucleotide sugar dehydrogenase [Patescibacteria group bacterium]
MTQKMAKNKLSVCVIGLGYVGLPLAIRCVEKGYRVLGLDLDRAKVKLINRGISPIEEKYLEENLPRFTFQASTDEKVIKKSDIILICVPTPVDEKFYPILEPVIKATKMIARNLKKGALVVLESTVNPGVCEEVIKPIFDKAEFKIGKDVFIAHCPERINPGDKKWNVTNIPRVVGAFEKNGLEKALKFYKSIVTGEIRPMKSIREAEAVKIVENSFRDINIAFVNELAKSFDKLDIDVKDVILGASTKPFAFMPHFPSCGVGGHCIPVDPYYLIERAKQSGFDHELLKIARKINNSMPAYTVELIQHALNEIKMPMKGTPIGVLGVAYKANVDDVRESPSLKIIKLLEKHGAVTLIFDPHIPARSNVKTLEELLKKSKAIVLVTDHDEFKSLSPGLLKRYGIKIVIDGKNCLDKNAILKSGIIYKGIGR